VTDCLNGRANFVLTQWLYPYNFNISVIGETLYLEKASYNLWKTIIGIKSFSLVAQKDTHGTLRKGCATSLHAPKTVSRVKP
jgi:hypothetical protein